ncbi:hypothetical protein MMC22_000548 [Lobaria immixta]|nr:hypothetical protein [Lobaria immixta]
MRLLVAFTLVSAVIAIPVPQPGPQSSSDSQATPNPQSTPDPQSTPQTPPRPDWESDPSLPPDSSGVNSWNGIRREGKPEGRIEDEDPPEWASYHNWGQAATDILNAVADFKTEVTVAVKFQIHSRNFAIANDPDGTRDYEFHWQNVYLVQEKKPDVSTPKNRKRGPDVWLASPPRTRKSKFGENLLEWAVKEKKDDGIETDKLVEDDA